MKKLFVLLLSCLLLAGCGAEPSVEASDPTPEASSQAQPEAVGLYEPDSTAETATKGAVRAYLLGDSEYVGLLRVGSQLLVISGQGDATLLSGDEGQIMATAAIDLPADYTPSQLRWGGSTIAYYAPESREVVLLDTGLQELTRIPLPEDISGDPAIHLGQQEIFYCLGSEIRALSIQTGISRLVRSHSGSTQELVGSYFNDTVLGCQITDEDGTRKIVYLYSDTGQVIHTDATGGSLETLNQEYFALRTDGSARQVLFGNTEGETMCLNVDSGNLIPALALGGAVQYDTVNRDLHLSFYDFASGSRSAEVTIPEAGSLTAACSDEDFLWLLCGQVLYRWDISASPASDEAVYTGNLYTAENPDTQGLAQCAQRAKELGEAYGITVKIWEDARNDVYPVNIEYQVSVIRTALDRLEEQLSALPEGFLALTGNLQVDLVRDVVMNRDAVQMPSGNGLRMVIPCVDVQRHFLQGLGWAVDTRVLGNSRDYDFWDDLNPEGFAYTYAYSPREDADTYAGAFIDETAMYFPTEDRARVFAAAILPGNDHLFSGEVLQKKLTMLCQAIREAYGLDDSPQVLPWEQYLAEPLAKTE